MIDTKNEDQHELPKPTVFSFGAVADSTPTEDPQEETNENGDNN